MVTINNLLTLLAVLAICQFVWAWFLSKEYMRIVGLAQDPVHRVAPETGWQLAVRLIRERWLHWSLLIGWPLGVTTLFTSLYIWLAIEDGAPNGSDSEEWAWFFLQPFAFLISLYPLMASMTLVLGTRFRRSLHLWQFLVVCGIFLAPVYYIALFFAVGYSTGYIFYVYPVSLIFSAAMMLASFVFALGQGDRYFSQEVEA